MDRNKGQCPWSFRRKIVVSTLGFCAFCVCYVMYSGHGMVATVAESIVGSAFTLAGAVIGSYIFGAVWNDRGLK